MDRGTINGSAARPVMAYFAHHKCASTWIMNILADLCTETGLQRYVVLNSASPHGVGPLTDMAGAIFEREALRERVDSVGADLVICGHADRLQADVLRPTKAFHVIRDPRDIIVSAYFSHLKTHSTQGKPQLQAHREELQRMSLDQGLLSEMAFSRTELVQMGEWDYTNEDVLELKMEDLTARPYEGFIAIANHLGMLVDAGPVRTRELLGSWSGRLLNRVSRRRGLHRLHRRIPTSAEILLGTVYAQRFDAYTGGRQRGSEDTDSHYRKGIAGDWINHFTADHVDAFNEQFGDLLVRLGYEQENESRVAPMV